MSPPRRRSDDLHLLVEQFLTEAEPPATTVPAGDAIPAAEAPDTSRSRGPTKTTLSLPTETAQRLRTWATARRTSHGDVVITALLERRAELAQRCAAEAERVALGLVSRLGRTTGDRDTITVRLPAAALGALDDTARHYAMTRSALAAVLVDLETGG